MPIKFTIDEVMKRHKITQKALYEQSGVRMNTIKDMRNGVSKALTVDNIQPLIDGINHLSGENYGLEALLIYVEPENQSEDSE